MASATQQTRYRRKLRKSKMGRKAKSLRNRNGTTPPFEVHSTEAVANEAELKEERS